MSSERLNWIDRARGVGIVLVVLGHSPILKGGLIHDVIFLFHMPLFFYVAGLVQKDVSFPHYLQSRFRALLVPYFVAGMLFSLIAAKFDWRQFVTGLGGVVTGIGDLMPQPHIWFLPCLFLIGLTQIAILRKIHQVSVIGLVLVLVSLAILAHISVSALPGVDVVDGQVSYTALPWSADLVPVGLLFFVLGMIVRRRFTHFVLRAEAHHLLTYVGLGLFLALSCFFSASGLMRLDLNHRIVSGFGVLLFAVVGVLSISGLCVLMRGNLGSLFEYLGSRSLVIFIFHYFIQSRIAVRIDGFGGAIIGFAGGLMLSLMIDLMIRKYSVLKWIFYPKNTVNLVGGNKP